METPEQSIRKINAQDSTHDVMCSICVATYRRPQLLEKLLLSLEYQILPDKVELEVIVVDNDPHKSAEGIIQKFVTSPHFKLYYFYQPKKNISLTRNMAVKKASGEYILFIDDDEIASPKWVCHLLETLERFKADAVVGPVMPEFNPQTPEWMRKYDLFYNPVGPTGTKAKFVYTGNCIIKASLLKELKEPFDPKYGVTGGEDSHLFYRLMRQGVHFVYCREAWATEFLPLDRTRLKYLFLRSLRGGNFDTRNIIEFAGKRQIWKRLFMLTKALAFGTASLIFMVGQFANALRRTKWLLKFASNIGRFMAALGWHYHGYR